MSSLWNTNFQDFPTVHFAKSHVPTCKKKTTHQSHHGTAGSGHGWMAGPRAQRERVGFVQAKHGEARCDTAVGLQFWISG